MSFYNEWVLAAFQGSKVAAFTGANEETFQQLDDKGWERAVSQSDSLQTRWYQSVKKATDQQLIE